MDVDDVEMKDRTFVESDGGDGVFVDDDENNVEWLPAQRTKVK